MLRFGFELVGTMPLLMHADDVEAADMLSEWRSSPENRNISKPGDDRSPPWTWQTYLYSDGENVVVPSECLMVTLRTAATQIKLKGNKTFKEVSQSGMYMPMEFLDLTVDGDKHVSKKSVESLRDLKFADQAKRVEKLGFRLFVKRARIGQSKHVRVRPRFDKWSLRGELVVIVPEITREVVETMFEIGGRVGLLDWRPGCKTPGPFGMFKSKLKLLSNK